MKLIIAIVQNKDAVKLRSALVNNNIMATKYSSAGSFLRSGNTTYLIALEDEKVDFTLELIKNNCSARKEYVSPTTSLGLEINDQAAPYEVQVGGATVMVLPIEAFHQF